MTAHLGVPPPDRAAGPEARLAPAAAEALRMTGAGSCSVLLPDRERTWLLAAAVAVTPEGTWTLDRVRMDDLDYATARSFRNGEPTGSTSRGILRCHPELASFAIYPFVAIAVPLYLRGEVRGTLTYAWLRDGEGPDAHECEVARAAALGVEREMAALEADGVPLLPPRYPLVVPGHPGAGTEPAAEAAAPAHFHLHRLAEELTPALSVAEIADITVDRLAHGFRVPAAAITLLEGDRLRLLGSVGCTPEFLARLTDPSSPAGLPEREAVARARRRFLRRGDHRVAGRVAGAGGAGCSWGVLPLRAGGRTVGTCSIAFTAEHPDILPEQSGFTAMSSLLGHTLERARLAEQQYGLVCGLQQALLPSPGPRSARLRIVDRYRPATAGLEIGGDWYDVIDRGEGDVTLVIGDVEGHSATAAVLMGQLRSAVRAYIAEGHDPGTVLGRTNELMIGLDAGRFATCCCLAFDPAVGAARMATAGHPLPLIRGPGGGYLTPPVDPGPPLGVVGRTGYRTAAFRIEPGSLLALFTDGIGPSGGLRPAGLDRVLAAGGGLGRAGDRLLDLAGPLTGAGPGGVPGLPRRDRGDDAALLLVRVGDPAAAA